MAKLVGYLEAEQLPLEMVLREAEADGRIAPRDLVYHVDYPDFRGRVVSVDDGRCKVKVLAGWRGRHVPADPVGVPTGKLEVVG